MKIPLVSVASNYPEMLNKITISTFLFGLGMTILARSQIPWLDEALVTKIDIELAKVVLPLGTVLPPVLFALLFRMVKLHDSISDVLKIREDFDVRVILIPMALELGVSIPASRLEKLRENRGDLMYETFYKYASGTPGKAVIDSHLITMALDQWTWYWILLEASVVAVITSLLLFFSGVPNCAFIILALDALAVVALGTKFLRSCAHYAHREVAEILRDTTRRQEIAKVFYALQD
jgi:hypothetical protein